MTEKQMLNDSVNQKIDPADMVGPSRSGGMMERKRRPSDRFEPVTSTPAAGRTEAEFNAAISREPAKCFAGWRPR